MPSDKYFTSKRLIVCCDGTWEDSTADANSPPSNVTRFSRALSRNAVVEENGQKREIPQIIFYQKGVGTGLGDKYWGGVAGLGLSANVRAAYGFLVDNYNPGDKIYFFGFSRGAYTARAVAGLVCQWGLLTARGMDNFYNVYNDFYNSRIEGYSPEKRRQLGFQDPLPRFTVEVIGVWDTVAFHQTWLGKMLGERLELRNTVLSKDVKYAFQALSLDEKRTAFQPTLWHLPEDGDYDGPELLQVWFSGVHTDVGGGGKDPRLSNIALAWMIAQCTKNNQLSFDINYLLDDPPRPVESGETPWATSSGETSTWSLTSSIEGIFGGTSKRTPFAYKPEPPGSQSNVTNEMLHISINDRALDGQPPGSVRWPCQVLKERQNTNSWLLVDGNKIVEAEVLKKEKDLKGRIRKLHVDRVD